MYKNFMHGNATCHLQNTLVPKLKALTKHRKHARYVAYILNQELKHYQPQDLIKRKVVDRYEAIKEHLDLLKKMDIQYTKDIKSTMEDIKTYRALEKKSQHNYDKHYIPHSGDRVWIYWDNEFHIGVVNVIDGCSKCNDPGSDNIKVHIEKQPRSWKERIQDKIGNFRSSFTLVVHPDEVIPIEALHVPAEHAVVIQDGWTGVFPTDFAPKVLTFKTKNVIYKYTK